jgi:omega-amidase
MKTGNRPLIALRFNTSPDYQANLTNLLSQIDATPNNAVVVAPEVCLTLFAYDDFERAADFAEVATKALLAHSAERIIILTMIVRRDDGIYNVARVFHGGEVVHEQAKSQLFHLGDEHRYFTSGNAEAITRVEVDGLSIGVLICFELRFDRLWQQLRGADLMVVPAQWGALRQHHFETLALMNQCYVIACDGDNDTMTRVAMIISPFGECQRSDDAPQLVGRLDKHEISKMRRYIDVGLA